MGVYFEVKEKERTCHLTDAGVREAERAGRRRELLHGRQHGVAAPHRQRAQGAPPVPARPRLHDRTATRGRTTSSAIIIVDEFTGRAMFGRQWSDGLHQAVEAKHKKDGVQIKQETQTLATVTLQNFFSCTRSSAA